MVPGVAHHVHPAGEWAGGGRFFGRRLPVYLRLLTENCKSARVTCLGYVLMPNHVHLILVPKDADGLRKALSATHRAYAGRSMRGGSAAGISGRGGSGASRWTAIMRQQHFATCCSIRCGRGW